MMTTGTEAYEAMRAHHLVLDEQLSTHVAAVCGTVAAGRPHEAVLAGLVAYLAEEVLPHATAEEETLYPAAAHGNLARIISEMIGEHRVLSASAGRLASAPDGAAAAEQAGQIAELFAAHVARENDILLPALLARRDADLAALLAQMHHRTEEAGRAVPASADRATGLPAAVMVLLPEAAAPLGRPSHEWYPPAVGRVIELDVLPPDQAAEAAARRLMRMHRDERLEIRSGRDPISVWRRIDELAPGRYGFVYLEDGPVHWRVRITRRA